MSPLVGVDDLTAGGKPNAIMLFDVGDGALQIFNAQRLADELSKEETLLNEISTVMTTIHKSGPPVSPNKFFGGSNLSP
jgi:hypothetical protein